MNDVTNKAGIALVTGGAGGMGAEAARLLAEQGWPLLLCDLGAARLEAVAAPLREAGAKVEILAGDISAPGFPAQLLDILGAREVGAMIHTAGLSPTMADGQRIMEVNYFAAERLVTMVRPKMAEYGCAVLISSCSAYMARGVEIDEAIARLLAGEREAADALAATPQLAYPISKRAIIALVAREAAAYGARKARIVSISPGLIDTGMGRAEMEASEYTRTMLERTPLARQGRPEEIASVAVFLCSEGASYVTGCDIKVDGGTLAAMGF